MTVEERPEPPDNPQPGELIVQPQAVGICGSEVEGYLGHMGNRVPPLIMVTRSSPAWVVAAGDRDSELDGARVAVNPLSGCGECRLCRAGHSNLCARPRADRRARRPARSPTSCKVPAAMLAACPTTYSSHVGALDGAAGR